MRSDSAPPASRTGRVAGAPPPLGRGIPAQAAPRRPFAFIAPTGLSKTRRLAHMSDSLVRVSRRVRWVTDLLAAGLRSPAGPPRRCVGPRPSRPPRGGAPVGIRGPGPRSVPRFGGERRRRVPRGGDPLAPRSGDEPPPGWLTTGDPHSAGHRPPAVSRPPGRRACTSGPAAASSGRETNASGTGGSTTPGTARARRMPCHDFPRRRPSAQTESSRHRISRAHPFTSEQFHVLLNSLFKVLCNFPSRYLFAIGLTAVFSLRWSLPPDWGCTPKQPDSQEIAFGAGEAAMGLAPATDRPRSGGLAAFPAPDALTPKRHISRDERRRGFGAGLFPFRSPLLRESLLVSFPPLIYMLKFSGSSRLI